MAISPLEIRKSRTKGRGVFATTAIKKGQTIDVAPYLFLTAHEHQLIKKTDLIRFIYDLGKGAAAVGLGFASLYNHSDLSNATYFIQKKKQTLTFKATQSIAVGEEVTIDYGFHPTQPETWDKDYAQFIKRLPRKK